MLTERIAAKLGSWMSRNPSKSVALVALLGGLLYAAVWLGMAYVALDSLVRLGVIRAEVCLGNAGHLLILGLALRWAIGSSARITKD